MDDLQRQASSSILQPKPLFRRQVCAPRQTHFQIFTALAFQRKRWVSSWLAGENDREFGQLPVRPNSAQRASSRFRNHPPERFPAAKRLIAGHGQDYVSGKRRWKQIVKRFLAKMNSRVCAVSTGNGPLLRKSVQKIADQLSNNIAKRFIS